MNNLEGFIEIIASDLQSIIGRKFLIVSGSDVRSCFCIGALENGQVKLIYNDDFELKTCSVGDNMFLTSMAPRSERSLTNEGDIVQLCWSDGERYDAMIVRRTTVNGRIAAFLYFFADSSVSDIAVHPTEDWTLVTPRPFFPSILNFMGRLTGYVRFVLMEKLQVRKTLLRLKRKNKSKSST